MRRNEEIKVCCCLTSDECRRNVKCRRNYKNRNHNHNYEGIQLENDSWSILINKLAFILEFQNVRRK